MQCTPFANVYTTTYGIWYMVCVDLINKIIRLLIKQAEKESRKRTRSERETERMAQKQQHENTSKTKNMGFSRWCNCFADKA